MSAETKNVTRLRLGLQGKGIATVELHTTDDPEVVNVYSVKEDSDGCWYIHHGQLREVRTRAHVRYLAKDTAGYYLASGIYTGDVTFINKARAVAALMRVDGTIAS